MPYGDAEEFQFPEIPPIRLSKKISLGFSFFAVSIPVSPESAEMRKWPSWLKNPVQRIANLRIVVDDQNF